MRRWVDQVAEAAEPDRATKLRDFGELLSRHIRIEERSLLEAIQESLSEDELADLGVVVKRESQSICPS